MGGGGECVCDVSSGSTLFAQACLTEYMQQRITYGKSHAQVKL